MASVGAAEVVSGVVEEMRRGEPAWLTPVARAAGIPVTDIAATALSTRAAALGLRTGRGFVHHDLRVRLPMPEGLEPEVAVWDGGTVPEWREGVLAEPKYFSFFQEAPLPIFNPNYRGKWRPHELLHGAVGSFWHPEMTRFEFYVGARLAEVLPVVHWYAWDEVFRRRCPEHERGGATRAHCPSCEAARGAFWEHDTGHEDIAAAQHWIERGLAHLAEELEACGKELETGRVAARPRPGLDSASDAQGYLRSHWNRCTAWSFGSWVEMFLEPGEDYQTTNTDLLGRVEGVALQLLGPAVCVDAETFARRFRRRALQDLGYRVLLELERRGEGDPAEAALWPLLEAAGVACGDALDGESGLAECREQLVAAVHEFGMADVAAQGIPWVARAGAEVKQVGAGLRSAFRGGACDAEAFAASPELWETGRLAGRYVRFRDRVAPELRMAPVEAAQRLAAWLAQEPRKDGEAELFGAVPDDPEALAEGRLRASATLRRGRFPASVLGESHDTEVELAAVIWDGETKVFPLTQAHIGVLGELAAGAAVSDRQAVFELVQVGAAVWFPPLRGGAV